VKKNGRFQNRNRIVQRFICKTCHQTFSEEQPLDGVRIEADKAAQVVRLLVEGVGILATSRLTGLNPRTVLNVLAAAGEHCARLLDSTIRNVEVESVQCDETFCFVGCKERNNTAKDYDRGAQYLFLSIDSRSKIILNHVIGKRDSGNANDLINDLNERVAGRFQLTTDSYAPYQNCVRYRLGERVDFAQLMKLYSGNKLDLNAHHQYSPPVCTGIRKYIRSGNPDRKLISTSYVERTNLSIRLFNRRFTRLTLGFSKKIEFLKHSVALFIAHFNFCRKHSAHSQTPAQAARLTNHQWSVEELLAITTPEKKGNSTRTTI
jgi:IS1 family transposase